MQNRSVPLQVIINLALSANNQGVRWDHMVDMVSLTIPGEQATRYRLSRLKRTPSETPTETRFRGQQAVARRYIDAAHRYGRITYRTAPDGQRWVHPGDPPTTGGRYAKPTEWYGKDSGPDSR